MIITEIINSNPLFTSSGQVVRISSNTLPDRKVVDTNNIDYCELECEYKEMVFGDTTSSDYWKNDKSSFLFQKLVSSDTIVLKLYKNCEEVETITDDKYGDYYNSFTNQLLYVGFIADWKKILTEEGAGVYQIKAEKTILGDSSTYESVKYQLYPYSDTLADKTVRIESYQTGNIESIGVDYTDLVDGGWYSSIRVRGRFGNKQQVKEVDNYLNNDYIKKQITVTNNYDYLFDTELIPSVIANYIIDDMLVGNDVLFTDYDIMNSELFRRVSVVSEENVERGHYGNQRKVRITEAKLRNKVQNNRKTNF